MTTTRGIDFTTLSLQDALDLAILIEEEAKDRYEELADELQLHRTPEAASFFHRMAHSEERHRAQLAARRAVLFPHALRTVTRSMIFDVEAPEYDEARAFMSLREALQVALRSERKAYNFFEQALPLLTDDTVKTLFGELRDEEVQHQLLVLKQLDQSPPEPLLSAEDFADEPAPQ